MDTRADDICRRMDAIRQTAGEEVETIVQSARALSDWRYYAKNHPWLCAGAAAGLGFMLIPRRKVAGPQGDDAKELIAMLKKHHVRGVAVAGPPSGLLKTVAGLATPLLIRAATNLLQARMASGDWSSLFGAKPAAAEPAADEQTFEEFNIPR